MTFALISLVLLLMVANTARQVLRRVEAALSGFKLSLTSYF